jgi:hypothetical protein
MYIILIVILFIGCGASRYNEPTSTNKMATLVIEQNHKLYDINQPFAMITNAYLDGKLIDAYKYQHMKVKIAPGVHTLILDISAYYSKRAKHSETKKYKINFQPNEMYIVSSNTKLKKLTSQTDNVIANYYIKGKGIVIADTVLLEDSALRSLVCQGEECVKRTRDAAIQGVIDTVIIPSM